MSVKKSKPVVKLEYQEVENENGVTVVRVTPVASWEEVEESE